MRLQDAPKARSEKRVSDSVRVSLTIGQRSATFRVLVPQLSKPLIRVIKTDSIVVGEVEGSQWVQVQGKGNFMSSPRLKEYVEGCLKSQKCEEVVVDLETCTAMDSTFMGTLAGLAGRLMEREGHLTVVGLSERNRDSLVDLGLDAILKMEEEDG